MSFAVDLVFSNVFFTASTALHLAPPNRITEDSNLTQVPTNNQLPHILVLVPLYNEVSQAVEQTFTSLTNQNYPQDKLHIRGIVEEGDDDTEEYVEQTKTLLTDEYDYETVVNTEGGMKAGAMNYALEHEDVDTEYLVIYDGDDDFEGDQIMKMVILAEDEGYDAIMPRVYRTGESLAGKLLTLDTHVWNTKILPFLYNRFGVFPQSGEGCFLRRSAVEDAGRFPHTLTEDAMMSVDIAENGGSFGLVESRVYEQAPTSLKGHYTQRLRWNRGYLTCIVHTLKSNMGWRKKLGFLLPFVAPLTSLFTLPTWIFFTLFWVFAVVGGVQFIAPWMTSKWYVPFLYWSAALAFLGNVFIIYSYMQTIAGTDFEDYAPYALLAPLYWLFLSVAAIGSVFRGTKKWGRTDRTR